MTFHVDRVITSVAEINLPYYARHNDHRYMALLREDLLLIVTIIDKDYRFIGLGAQNKTELGILMSGAELTQEEFKAFYQRAITDIDEQVPCSDLKLSDPLPELPY
jgi:hypothetical protein